MNINCREHLFWLKDKTSVKFHCLCTQVAVFIQIQQIEMLDNVPSCKYSCCLRWRFKYRFRWKLGSAPLISLNLTASPYSRALCPYADMLQWSYINTQVHPESPELMLQGACCPPPVGPDLFCFWLADKWLNQNPLSVECACVCQSEKSSWQE